MLYLLLFGTLLTDTISVVMSKKNSSAFSVNGLTGSLFYVCETSLFALFYFWALNGFSLAFNLSVVVYGFLYALIVIISMVPSIFVYNYASFAFVRFVSSGTKLAFSLIGGIILFDEVVTPDKLLRIFIMICVITVIFIGQKRKMPDDNNEKQAADKKKLLIAISIILFSALIGVASTVLLKLYSADSRVTDQNSFFFMTNIFSAFLVLPILPFTMKRNKVAFSDLCGMVKSKKTVYAAVTTLNSNIGSIILMPLIAMMDISVFTPLTSAFSFIAVAIATPIVGEKLNRYTLIATGLAVLSVVLPAVLF